MASSLAVMMHMVRERHYKLFSDYYLYQYLQLCLSTESFLFLCLSIKKFTPV